MMQVLMTNDGKLPKTDGPSIDGSEFSSITGSWRYMCILSAQLSRLQTFIITSHYEWLCLRIAFVHLRQGHFIYGAFHKQDSSALLNVSHGIRQSTKNGLWNLRFWNNVSSKDNIQICLERDAKAQYSSLLVELIVLSSSFYVPPTFHANAAAALIFDRWTH